MKWFVYIIKSEKNSQYYIGSTNDFDRRLKEYNLGRNKSTKNKGPWELVYQEFYETRVEARRRELKIKSYKSENAFKNLLK